MIAGCVRQVSNILGGQDDPKEKVTLGKEIHSQESAGCKQRQQPNLNSCSLTSAIRTILLLLRRRNQEERMGRLPWLFLYRLVLPERQV